MRRSERRGAQHPEPSDERRQLMRKPKASRTRSDATAAAPARTPRSVGVGRRARRLLPLLVRVAGFLHVRGFPALWWCWTPNGDPCGATRSPVLAVFGATFFRGIERPWAARRASPRHLWWLPLGQRGPGIPQKTGVELQKTRCPSQTSGTSPFDTFTSKMPSAVCSAATHIEADVADGCSDTTSAFIPARSALTACRSSARATTTGQMKRRRRPHRQRRAAPSTPRQRRRFPSRGVGCVARR